MICLVIKMCYIYYMGVGLLKQFSANRLVLGGIVLAALLLGAGPAGAHLMPVQGLLRPRPLTQQPASPEGDHIPPEFSIPDTIWIDGLGIAPWHHYLWVLIRVESWDSWLAFRNHLGTPVVLSSISIMYKGGYIRKRPPVRVAYSSRRAKRGSSEVAQRSSPPPTETKDVVAVKLQRLEQQLSYLIGSSPAPVTSKGFSFSAFLFEEEGIFSGRPWDWENFLPRLLTIGGIVVGALLFTEFMRLIFGLGRRRKKQT